MDVWDLKKIFAVDYYIVMCIADSNQVFRNQRCPNFHYTCNRVKDTKIFLFVCKVEKILKVSQDSIPSPSMKIQIIGGKFD